MNDQSISLDNSKISRIHGQGEENDPKDKKMRNDSKIDTLSKKLRE